MAEQNKQTAHNLSEKINAYQLMWGVFHHAPMGMVIVDDKKELVLANSAIFRIFHQAERDVTGMRFGNVFHCAYAEKSANACGDGERCQNCDLRNGVSMVLEERGLISGVELAHEFFLDERTEKKWFAVSATPFYQDERAFALVTFFDITKQKNYENLLYQQSITDSGSGALNKGQIIRVLNSMNLGTEFSAFTVAMIDFDHFKQINDRFGHLVGDKIIRNFTEISLHNLREGDSIGRFGGEEFLLFFPRTTAENARGILERIGRKIGTCAQVLTGDTLTFSGGLIEVRHPLTMGIKDTLIDHEHIDIAQNGFVKNAEEMIHAADLLLYQAKNRGRNRILSAVVYGQNEGNS